MKKTITYSFLSIAAVASMAVMGGFLISQVSAQIEDGDYPPIIENLAEAFGVTPDEVQEVFEETREQQKEARLDNAVENGVITEDQKSLILEKQEELQSSIEEINNQSLTAEERREAMHELMEEVRTWAEENDIPPGFVGGGGMKGRGGKGIGSGQQGDFGGMTGGTGGMRGGQF